MDDGLVAGTERFRRASEIIGRAEMAVVDGDKHSGGTGGMGVGTGGVRETGSETLYKVGL